MSYIQSVRDILVSEVCIPIENHKCKKVMIPCDHSMQTTNGENSEKPKFQNCYISFIQPQFSTRFLVVSKVETSTES